MKKSYYSILLLLLCSLQLRAQFSSSGSIEFTRVTNLRLSMQLEMADENTGSSHMSEFIKRLPKHKNSYFKMDFDRHRSIYFFDKEGTEQTPFWGKDPASENIVIKNFDQQQMNAQKEVYEHTYIIRDSIPHYEWKILDELRPIAGYTCRKATTVIDDSVVVVAYYTEQIMVSSGPESFGGLPGMILGLAIPRLYTTWFATKVSPVQLHENELKKISKKGKEINQSTLWENLQERMKNWSRYGNTILWKVKI